MKHIAIFLGTFVGVIIINQIWGDASKTYGDAIAAGGLAGDENERLWREDICIIVFHINISQAVAILLPIPTVARFKAKKETKCISIILHLLLLMARANGKAKAEDALTAKNIFQVKADLFHPHHHHLLLLLMFMLRGATKSEDTGSTNLLPKVKEVWGVREEIFNIVYQCICRRTFMTKIQIKRTSSQ